MTNKIGCYICSKDGDEGIIIKGRYICSDCEKEIVNIVPKDQEYEGYKDKIKEILFQ